METKELLTVEFRYTDFNNMISDEPRYQNTTITIGVYDTIEEAVEEGNKVMKQLSKSFEVRASDYFKVRGLGGYPKRLNASSYSSNKGVGIYVKIDKLAFSDLSDTIKEVYAARSRYKNYQDRQAMLNEM